MTDRLCRAVLQEDYDQCKEILKADASLIDEIWYRTTALHDASYRNNIEMVSFLLEHKADPNTEATDGTTALIPASDMNNLDMVKLLLDHKANPNAEQSDGTTALINASHRNNLDMVRLLLDHKVDPNAKTKDGISALHHASNISNLDLVQLLLDHDADSNAKTWNGTTPLHNASYRNNIDMVQLLLDHQADPTTKERNGTTALTNASAMNNLGMTKLLLEHNADPNDKTKDGTTALHHASENNNLDMVQLLLECKADSNAKTKDGIAAIHHASDMNNLEMVKLLLDYKADPNAKTMDGLTALHNTSLGNNLDLVKLLLDYDADPDTKAPDGTTALHHGSEIDNIDMVRSLLDHGADPNMEKTDGTTALHNASEIDNLDMVNILLAHKADPNVKIKDGHRWSGTTALHHSSDKNNLEMVKVLLNHKADPTATTTDGTTALHHASNRDNLDMVQLLLDHKVDVNAKTMNLNYTALHIAAANGSKEIITTLLAYGASASIESKYKTTALTVADDYDIEFGLWMRKEQNKKLYKTLMKSGKSPVPKTSIFLCGDSGVGKTVLKQALSRSVVSSFLGKGKDIEEKNNAITAGIEISEVKIEGCGSVYCWEYAGQPMYHLLHPFFIGKRYVTCIMYNISQRESAHESVYYWLSFIKATRQIPVNAVDRIILIATHWDIVKRDGWEHTAKQLASEIVTESREQFGKTFLISESIITVTSFKPRCSGMLDLRRELSRSCKAAKDGRTIPTICELIMDKRTAWVADSPFLYWSEFISKFKEDVQRKFNEDELKDACTFLSYRGEIYFAQLHRPTDEDIVVLDPAWISYTICGQMFASSENGVQCGTFKPIFPQKFFRKEKMVKIFQGQDIEAVLKLLQHMRIAYNWPKKGYIIPGMLPPDLPEIKWKLTDNDVCYGITVICSDETSTLSGSFFPLLQVQTLLAFPETFDITRLSLKVVESTNNVEGLIHFTVDKSQIFILTKVDDTTLARESALFLTKLLNIVKQQMKDSSPGTITHMMFLSPGELKEQTGDVITEDFLYEITSYPEEQLMLNDTEAEHNNKIWNKCSSKWEDIVDIKWNDFPRDVLMELANEISENWMTIGVALGHSQSKLKEWQLDNPNNLEYCILTMLINAQQHDIYTFSDRLQWALEKSGRTDLIHLFLSKCCGQLSVEHLTQPEVQLAENNDDASDVHVATSDDDVHVATSDDDVHVATSDDDVHVDTSDDLVVIPCESSTVNIKRGIRHLRLDFDSDSCDKIAVDVANETGLDWKQLGICLGISDVNLHRFEEDNKGNVENAVFHMLMFAMKSTSIAEFKKKLAVALIDSCHGED